MGVCWGEMGGRGHLVRLGRAARAGGGAHDADIAALRDVERLLVTGCQLELVARRTAIALDVFMETLEAAGRRAGPLVPILRVITCASASGER